MVSKSKARPLVPYNGFTKSCSLRYVVHAFRSDDTTRSICGRNMAQNSKVKFDIEADGSCKKCVRILEIEARMHPGYDG